jgi:hypothetical protein
MTDAAATSHRSLRPLTYVALGVSVLTSASLWYASVGRWPSPEFVLETVGWWLLIGVLGIPAGIVLDILAGQRGGINRVISVVAGLMLISPAVAFAKGLILESTGN